MEKSSKNRLMPRHASLFKTESLFDKIARAVCRAATLPRKELYESWETARRVRRKYRGGRAMDLACGSLTTQKILDTITPKNRLLMGHPIASSAPQTSLENGNGNGPHDDSHKGV